MDGDVFTTKPADLQTSEGGGGGGEERMYLWWSLCTLYLPHAR